MKKSTKGILVYGTFGLFVLVIVLWGLLARWSLHAGGIVTSATIDDVRRVGREGMIKVSYTFQTPGGVMHDDASYGNSQMRPSNYRYLPGKSIPIIYKHWALGLLSRPLIFPDDFKYYGHRAYPDSMKWILTLEE